MVDSHEVFVFNPARMKPINIPIHLHKLTEGIPLTVPVNFEFTFCEQFPDPVVYGLVQNPELGYADVIDNLIRTKICQQKHSSSTRRQSQLRTRSLKSQSPATAPLRRFTGHSTERPAPGPITSWPTNSAPLL